MPATPNAKAAHTEQHRSNGGRREPAAQVKKFVDLDHADGEADQRHEKDDDTGKLTPRRHEVVAQIAAGHAQNMHHEREHDGHMRKLRCPFRRRKGEADKEEGRDGDRWCGHPCPEREFVVEQRHDEQPEKSRRQHREELERNVGGAKHALKRLDRQHGVDARAECEKRAEDGDFSQRACGEEEAGHQQGDAGCPAAKGVVRYQRYGDGLLFHGPIDRRSAGARKAAGGADVEIRIRKPG